MRYLSVPRREEYEAELLPRQFGKAYQPWGDVTLRPDASLSRAGVDLLDIDGETLAIAADTASWAFLSQGEARLYRDLAPGSFASFGSRWPDHAAATAAEFVSRLYRRGLLGVDGQRAVDPTVFDDSPNVPDGHLVELLLTEKCNLGCTYCLAGANSSMPRMTPEIARRTVDLAFAMSEAKDLAFEFSGGEPFLEYPLMRDLVEVIRRHSDRAGRPVHINVQTNCTLLNAERVGWLRDNDIRVGISLDGRPESHNRSRPRLGGGESFDQLINGIDLLQRMGVPFGALVVLNRSNVDSAEELVYFLLDNGIQSFKLNPVAYLGTARGSWDAVGLTPDEVVAYVTRLARIITGRPYPLLEDNLRVMCEFLISKQRAARCLRSHCGAGDTFQAVSAAGDIYPCGRATQSPGLRLGNVLDGDVTTLSQPGRRSLVIAEIRERRPSTLAECSACPYRQLCQAGCSAQAFERYGTVRHRTPECTFYKTMYPYLMRWLSFDQQAVATLSALGYFGAEGVLISRDHI